MANRVVAGIPLNVGDVDGHGRFGTVEETEDGLVCHECGKAFAHLGLHAFRGHGITASDYRRQLGLAAKHRLITSAVRQRIRANATARMSTPAGAALRTARDPAHASRVRLARAEPPRPEVLAALRRSAAAMARGQRLGTVITCQRCGSQFCPLYSAKPRRYCSKSCASKTNRANQRQYPKPRLPELGSPTGHELSVPHVRRDSAD